MEEINQIDISLEEPWRRVERETIFNGYGETGEVVNVRIPLPLSNFKKAMFTRGRAYHEHSVEISYDCYYVIFRNVNYWNSKTQELSQVTLKIAGKKGVPIREAKHLSKFDSKHVVKMKAFGYAKIKGDQTPGRDSKIYKFGYLVVENCNQGSLGDFLDSRPRLSTKEVFSYFYQICQGLRDIHRAGVRHHDIKPEHILIHREENSGNLVLKIDGFGFSVDMEFINWVLNVEKEGTLVMVGGKSGYGFGTPGYFPPELIPSVIKQRINNCKNHVREDQRKEVERVLQTLEFEDIWKDYIDQKIKCSAEKADIFPLGLVLFYLATGKPYNFRIDQDLLDFESAGLDSRLSNVNLDLKNLIYQMTHIDFRKRLGSEEVFRYMKNMKLIFGF